MEIHPSSITHEQITPYVNPICPECNIHKRYRKGWLKDGVTPRFHSKCNHCRGYYVWKKSVRDIPKYNRRRNQKRKFYPRFKKDVCELCGFVPVNSCQLDVDHIDGDRENNDTTNLQTLCANCHRLKTYDNKDWNKTERARD